MKKLFLLLVASCSLFPFSAYSQMGEWTWMNGSNTINSLGHYGTQGVYDSLNSPPGLYEPCEWTDQQGNFWLFGGFNTNTSANDYLGDLWEFNVAINQWRHIEGNTFANQAGIYGIQTVSSPSNHPGCRGYGVATWVDNNNNLWLFGGIADDSVGNQGAMNDLWKYDINTGEWTWMKGSNLNGSNGYYGIMGVANAANNPSSRSETNATWVDANNNLWLFGGFSNGGSGLNDLWKYDISNNEWTWMKGSSVVNAPAVYGTKGVEDIANTPGGRLIYSKWKDFFGNFWIFGGSTAGTTFYAYNDMWKYDVSTNNWVWMSGTNNPNDPGADSGMCNTSINNTPLSRYENRACWTRDCENFELFGGVSSNAGQFYNDLWNYNVQTDEWTLMSGSIIPNQTGHYGSKTVSSPLNIPGSRFGSVSWKDNNGNLWLFGGSGLFPSNFFNDMWRFVPDTSCPHITCLGLGINEQSNDKPSISIYPNPNSGTFTISINSQLSILNSQLFIKDVLEREVYKQSLISNSSIINTNLNNGIYFWEVISDKGIDAKGKVIIQK